MSRYQYLDRNDGSLQEHVDPDPDRAVDEALQAALDNPCFTCRGTCRNPYTFTVGVACPDCEGTGVRR